jgi:uncharacterized protein
MSTEDNVNTIKAIYNAFQTGDVDTIVDAVTDDVDWATDAASDSAPWFGQRKGKDEVREFFTAIAGAVEVRDFRLLSLAANDDDEVLAFVGYRFARRDGGREGAMNLHHYWHFRDGKIDRCRASEDTEQTAEVLRD